MLGFGLPYQRHAEHVADVMKRRVEDVAAAIATGAAPAEES